MHIVPVCFQMEGPVKTALEDPHQRDAVLLPAVPEDVHFILFYHGMFAAAITASTDATAATAVIAFAEKTTAALRMSAVSRVHCSHPSSASLAIITER